MHKINGKIFLFTRFKRLKDTNVFQIIDKSIKTLKYREEFGGYFLADLNEPEFFKNIGQDEEFYALISFYENGKMPNGLDNTSIKFEYIASER